MRDHTCAKTCSFSSFMFARSSRLLTMVDNRDNSCEFECMLRMVAEDQSTTLDNLASEWQQIEV